MEEERVKELEYKFTIKKLKDTYVISIKLLKEKSK